MLDPHQNNMPLERKNGNLQNNTAMLQLENKTIKIMQRNFDEIKVETRKAQEAYKDIIRLADRWYTDTITPTLEFYLMG